MQAENKIPFFQTGFDFFWCPRWDLNPHTRRHTHLKRTCLPFHHLGIYDKKPWGFYGAPSRVRTYNQRLRRPLLFQLSYGCKEFPKTGMLADYSKRIWNCKFILLGKNNHSKRTNSYFVILSGRLEFKRESS